MLYSHKPRLPQDLPRQLPSNDTDDYNYAAAIQQRAEVLHRLCEVAQEVRETLVQQQARYNKSLLSASA
jgi:cation transport regulator ChaB